MHFSVCVRSAFALAGVALGVAHAQVSLVSRSSTQSYKYLYGWSTDIHQDNVSSSRGALSLSDTMSTTYTGYTQGTYPPINGSWTAGIDGDLNQSYSIAGSAAQAWSISASGRSDVSTFATGIGFGQNQSIFPGNELVFEFDVVGSTEFSLNAAYGGLDVYRPSYLALQFFDGFTWQYNTDLTNYFNGDISGTISRTGTLGAGRYRMISNISLDARVADGYYQDAYGDYNYTLSFGSQPVPEPSTMALLGFAALAARKKLKRTKS